MRFKGLVRIMLASFSAIASSTRPCFIGVADCAKRLGHTNPKTPIAISHLASTGDSSPRHHRHLYKHRKSCRKSAEQFVMARRHRLADFYRLTDVSALARALVLYSYGLPEQILHSLFGHSWSSFTLKQSVSKRDSGQVWARRFALPGNITWNQPNTRSSKAVLYPTVLRNRFVNTLQVALSPNS